MLITVLVAGSLVLGSITNKVNAASVEDLESTYPYIYWLRDYNVLVVSKKALTGTSIGSSTSTTTSIKVMPYPYQTWFESTTKDVLYCMTISGYSRGDAFALTYNPITGWDAEYPSYITSNALGTTPTSYSVAVYIAETQNRYTYSNGVAIPSGFYNAGTTLPDNIPPLENVQEAINNALNATTSVTTQAVTINNNINNTYNTYQSGGITEAEFNAAMDQYRDQLETLANNSGATLADRMAVNNALTNLDITINQQVNNVSPDLLDLLDNIRSRISSTFNSYHGGGTSQSEAINLIKGYINDNLLKQTISYTSVADRTAINGTIEYGNQIINAIGNHSDLDKSISESFESSESEEIELLNEMLGVMQDQETGSIMENQQVKEDLTAVSTWLEPIWENDFFKLLIGSVALLASIAVILDMRYRGL